MELQSLKIIFMGTPDFATASLKALVEAGCNIVGVVTAPDKPAGRGLKLHESDVKKYAVEKNLKILQPEKLKDQQFLDDLKALKADLQVVVAFRMLPEVVWEMPPMGTINLHASLLPQYRGAAPINWAIINGEKETGVTTFKLKHEIDTGDILLQGKIEIGENETAGELHDRMKEIGAALLVKTVKGLGNDELKEISQDNIQSASANAAADKHSTRLRSASDGQTFNIQHSSLKHAPKIFTETCRIDWNKSVAEIHNLVRGLSPHPAAFTELQGKTLKVYRTEKELAPPLSLPGNFETDKKSFLKFACTNGYIHIKELQLEGKKKMTIEEFLRGYRFA